MNKIEQKGKMLEGKVVSQKTPMTVIVAVSSSHKHPLYKKAVRKITRFAAHNVSLTLAVGDTVQIKESKPITKTKHFIVVAKLN
jgi:small subunit ribosomal protein S17